MTVPVVAPPGIGSESCRNAGVLAGSNKPTASRGAFRKPTRKPTIGSLRVPQRPTRFANFRKDRYLPGQLRRDEILGDATTQPRSHYGSEGWGFESLQARCESPGDRAFLRFGLSLSPSEWHSAGAGATYHKL
jgi:hypothetical protein